MANFISQESIETVKRTADIVSVVSEYVQLEKRGSSDYWACCPFHGEKTPSFHLIPDKNAYYCFGCHASGSSAIKFVQEIEKISFVEAVTLLANKYGIKLIYADGKNPEAVKFDDSKQKTIELYDRVSSTFHYLLTEDPRGKAALDYIKGRGISDETIKKFRLGYSPADRYFLKKFLLNKNFSDDFLNKSGLFSQNYQNISFFSDRLMFPIFDRHGQCVAFGGRILHPQGENDRKYLNSRELPHYSKKNTLYAFNFAKDQIRMEKTVIICEGYMDCIAYHQSGIKNAVATCGTALTDEQIKMLAQITSNGTVLLSFDSDGAGQNATYKSILLCRKHELTVKVVRLRGGKDPAEIMVNFGKEVLSNDVKNAILDADYLFESLSHKYPIDSPEGKTKIALDYFPYVDVLQTDMQKETCLEQLAQKLRISVQSVFKDYKNRRVVPQKTIVSQQQEIPVNSNYKDNIELVGILAALTDISQFAMIQREFNEDVFETLEAKQIYSIMEDCFQKGTLSFDSVYERIDDKNLQDYLSKVIVSGEYKLNTEKIVQDWIVSIKKKEIRRQIEYINQRLKSLGNFSTPEEQKEIDNLFAEKIKLDKLLK